MIALIIFGSGAVWLLSQYRAARLFLAGLVTAAVLIVLGTLWATAPHPEHSATNEMTAALTPDPYAGCPAATDPVECMLAIRADMAK